MILYEDQNNDVGKVCHNVGRVYYDVGRVSTDVASICQYVDIVYHDVGCVYRDVGCVYHDRGRVYHYNGSTYDYIGELALADIEDDEDNPNYTEFSKEIERLQDKLNHIENNLCQTILGMNPHCCIYQHSIEDLHQYLQMMQ